MELRTELTQYLSTGPEDVKDPLLWWVGMQAVYPCLSRMARNYLTIPGMFL
jgi:hAT family protein